MSQKITKAAKADKIVQAWKIINAFSLNDDILVAGHAEKRFCMITEAGRRTTAPDSASAIFDCQTGRAFVPQDDPIWFQALIERFKIRLDWNEETDSWEATARHAGLAERGLGESPAQAMFGALEALAEQAHELTQDQTPERKTFGAGASRT